MQRTDEWYQARLGKATASRMGDLTARTKTGWGASRENYLWELVIERRTGRPFESYTSRAMQSGIEREPQARAMYAMGVFAVVSECGFCPHSRIEMSGASPDGFVGEHGLVEIKCPDPKAHYNVLTGGAIPESYIKQMQWQMACTGRDWCDWVSFYPHTVDIDQLIVKRIYRNEQMISLLETQVEEFLKEVDDKVNLVRSIRELREVLTEAAA